MDIKKLEIQVSRNAAKLDKMDLSQHKGKFVVFDGKEILEAATFSEAVALGKEAFGVEKGFVVRQQGKTPVLSSLVLM